MAETHKPGHRVPETGEISCTQHTGVREEVKAGGTFGLCTRWREDREECRWEYAQAPHESASDASARNPTSPDRHEEIEMAQTYKPGDRVPKTGAVKCTQHAGTRDKVNADDTFAPCMHWGEHDRKECTWEYV